MAYWVQKTAKIRLPYPTERTCLWVQHWHSNVLIYPWPRVQKPRKLGPPNPLTGHAYGSIIDIAMSSFTHHIFQNAQVTWNKMVHKKRHNSTEINDEQSLRRWLYATPKRGYWCWPWVCAQLHYMVCAYPELGPDDWVICSCLLMLSSCIEVQ